MWNIVIADDEPKIREGLKDTIQSFGLDIAISGEAKNGEDALRMVAEKHPDIIVLDINMPKLNGIQLMERIQNLDYHCKMMIISGYDEFEYAKRAMYLGVKEYLLKPIIEKELKKALENLIEELKAERNKERYFELAIKQLNLHKSYLQEIFFSQWVKEEYTEEEIKEHLEILSIVLEPRVMVGMISAQDNGDGVVNAPEMAEQLFKYSLQNIVSDCLERHMEIYIFSDQFQNIIFVSNHVTAGIEQVKDELLQEIQNILGMKAIVMIATGPVGELPAIYSRLRGNIRQQMSCKPMVLAAKQYIYEHFSNQELDLPLLARTLGVNPNYISRLMKQQSGLSFKELLTNIRISKAIELMKKEEYTILDISEQVGYSTQHYFSTAFKNMMGISPSDYRKREVL